MTPRSLFEPPPFCTRRYHASSVSIQTERHAGTHRATQSRARRDTQHTTGGVLPCVCMARQGARRSIGLSGIIRLHGRADGGALAEVGRARAGVDRGRLGDVGAGSSVIDSHVIPCMIVVDFTRFLPLLPVPLHTRRVSSGGGRRGSAEVRE
jgi:hypothetical protein